MFRSIDLPIDIINTILHLCAFKMRMATVIYQCKGVKFDGRINYRNGKYIDAVPKGDFRRAMITDIIIKKN